MIITQNGRYGLHTKIKGTNSDKFILYISGLTGTAAMQLQYRDELGVWVNLENGVMLTDTQNQVVGGVGSKIYINITNADGVTNLAMTVRGIT